jgi:hypothetical protein
MDDYTQMVLSEMAHQLLSGDGKIRLQAVEGASRSEAYAHKHKKREEEEMREEGATDGQAQGSEKEIKDLGEGGGEEEGGGDEDESGQQEQKEEEEEGEETEVG